MAVGNDILWHLVEFGLLFGLLSNMLQKLLPEATAPYLPVGGDAFSEVAIILMFVTFCYGVHSFLAAL